MLVGILLVAGSSLAFAIEPELDDIPDFEVRVMRGGTEIEVTGGIRPGINDALVAALDGAPNAQVIHLDSGGGLLDEGRKLYRTIHSRHLDTYVYNLCASACVMAFAAGDERLISAGASIGFHQARSPAGRADSRRATRAYVDFLADAGIDRALLARVSRVSSENMWYPDADELREANVITDVVPDDRFAASGLGAHVTLDSVREAFDGTMPALRGMRLNHVKAYDDITTRIYEAYSAANSWQAIRDEVDSAMAPFIAMDTPRADDETILAIGQFFVDQLRVLAASQPEVCHDHAVGIAGDIVPMLPSALQEWSMQLGYRVLATAGERQRPAQRSLDRLWRKTFALMEKRVTPGEMALLDADAVEPSQYRDYCNMAASLYESILQLAPGEAAALLRTTLTPDDAAGGARR